MANKHRAEVEREIGGTTYTFRLSFSALMHIEDDIGKPFLQWAADDLGSGILALRDLATLFSRALEAGGHVMEQEEVRKLLDELELQDAIELITDLVGVAFPQPEEGEEPDEGE